MTYEKVIRKYIPENKTNVNKRVLIVHGFAHKESVYNKLIEELGKCGVECHTFTLPGFNKDIIEPLRSRTYNV